jgi:hypothetical protein
VSSRFKTQEKIKTVTLFEIFNLWDKKPNEDIFLKMDIEGNEIKILKSLPQEMYANISVISIEILPGNETLNFVDQLNDFVPPNESSTPSSVDSSTTTNDLISTNGDSTTSSGDSSSSRRRQ